MTAPITPDEERILRSVQSIDESIARLKLTRSTLLSMLPKREKPGSVKFYTKEEFKRLMGKDGRGKR